MNGAYLIQSKQHIAEAILEVSWIADGVEESEREAVQTLINLAASVSSENLAMSLVGMSWFADDISEDESALVQDLSFIVRKSKNLAMLLVGMSWFADDISKDEFATVKYLARLAQESEPLAMSLVGKSWFADGVSENEFTVIRHLRLIAQESEPLAMSLVGISWFADGVSENESAVVLNLSFIAQESEPLAVSLMEAVLLADGVSENELTVIRYLSFIAQESEILAMSLMEAAWLADGVSENESTVILNLSLIARESESLAISLMEAAWFADGVSEDELTVIRYLSLIAQESEPLAMSLMGISWFADSVSEDESTVILNLSLIARKDAGAAERIIAMPFLVSLEPPDVSAVDSLGTLTSDDLADAMSRPTLADGVTDSEAPIVAMLHGVYSTEPELVDVLLDPSRVYVERKTARLPLSGEVGIVIVRTKPGAERSMALVENAVRTAENLMARPLPNNYVGVLFEEAGFAGSNSGTHIAIRSKYDVDDGSHEADSAPAIIVHEVAHYYWRGNADWVDEGMSELMASAIENRRDGKPIVATNKPCSVVKTIAELESLRSLGTFFCNYSLGERLFLDLRRTLGENAFWNGARALYDMSLVDAPNDGSRGTSINISHVRDAFGGESESVATVISRWYDGTEAHDISGLDASSPNPAFSMVNGQIDSVRSLMTDNGNPYGFEIGYSFGNVSELRKIHIEVAVFYEDGFEFHRWNVEITANPGNYLRVSGSGLITVFLPLSFEGVAAGRYWVYVYEGDNKLAEATYEVVP